MSKHSPGELDQTEEGSHPPFSFKEGLAECTSVICGMEESPPLSRNLYKYISFNQHTMKHLIYERVLCAYMPMKKGGNECDGSTREACS